MIRQKNFRTIFAGAVLLTANAGYINTIVLLGIYHNAVSYMTGNLAEIGFGIEMHSAITAFLSLSVVVAFIVGAIFTGMIISTSHFCINQNYAKALLLLAGLLAGSAIMMSQRNPSHYVLIISQCLAAMACGMQNALTTTFSGATIRTTHMTGILTDLGIELGKLIKYKHAELWKVGFFTMIIVSFILGSMLGVLLFRQFLHQALWFPVVICIISAFCYYIWRRFHPKL